MSTFKQFIQDNKDEITALQLIYSKPYGQRHMTYQLIKDLAEAIKKPPYRLETELVWQAYEQLEKAKVRGAGARKLLTNIISLVRFAAGKSDVLEPFSETVDTRFNDWLAQQNNNGRSFTPEQLEWLVMIKDHIAASASMEMDDFELTPFLEKGGAVKANRLFQQQLDKLLAELNEVLVA